MTLDAYVQGIPAQERQCWGNMIVKMDVEGYEPWVIRGSTAFLTTEKRPILILAEALRADVEKIDALLQEMCFDLVEEIQPRLFRRAKRLPNFPVNDLCFLKNVKPLGDGATFEWPFPEAVEPSS